ncbi:Cofactor assembly of complex C subunit B, CCB2/CCB4 [Dillenia turbinata]|uniref:Cofactor assembly of complex C subunit B, CCB2/CCB4 n=1 Tax=Dillenia turbinata TaxID=194707 RepID=A0AAN8VA18_9MAGN
MLGLPLNPSIPARPLRSTRKSFTVSATDRNQQEVNLSVLRFTFGIPGLDESYLPGWIGYGFGGLLLLNHFLGPNSATTPAQLRSEALGLSLAAFSISLPYLGRFLKGSTLGDRSSLPKSANQVFIMSEDVTDMQKEDLAWGTYVLLRNTNAISVLILLGDVLCVRGYWDTPEDVSKAQLLDWFKRQIVQIGLSDLKEALYFPKTEGKDSKLWKVLPNGTRSLLIQPILQPSKARYQETEKIEGFVFLASSMNYAYNDKYRSWIEAVANKFSVRQCNVKSVKDKVVSFPLPGDASDKCLST